MGRANGYAFQKLSVVDASGNGALCDSFLVAPTKVGLKWFIKTILQALRCPKQHDGLSARHDIEDNSSEE